MAIARIGVGQQVRPVLAFPAPPIHLDQFGGDMRRASADDPCRFDGAGKRTGDQRCLLKSFRQPQACEMIAGLRVQRLVNTALDAADAVPRGMTVTKQREACGNQRRRPIMSGPRLALSVSRAEPSR